MRRAPSLLMIALVALVGTSVVIGLALWVPQSGDAVSVAGPAGQDAPVVVVSEPAPSPRVADPVGTPAEPSASADAARERSATQARRAHRRALARERARAADIELAALVRRAERKARVRQAALRRKAALARTAASTTPFSFGLTQFNILGSNHTSPGSDADHFAPGGIRTEWAASFVDSVGADVVGFSEIQRDQLGVFARATGGRFEAWPGTALGGSGIPASLVWRTNVFTATEKKVVTIPFMGQQREQPYVKLRHNQTGRELWVMNVHNAPRDHEAERNVAEARELAILKDLRATGLPVFFIGDMNEKAEIFCNVTGATDLGAAQGGSNDGTCRPPRQMRVDWIFGSPDARFDAFRFDRSTAARRITDHAVLVSKVTIP